MINILKTAIFAALFMAFVLVFVPLRWVMPPGTGIVMPLGLLGLVSEAKDNPAVAAIGCVVVLAVGVIVGLVLLIGWLFFGWFAG